MEIHFDFFKPKNLEILGYGEKIYQVLAGGSIEYDNPKESFGLLWTENWFANDLDHLEKQLDEWDESGDWLNWDGLLSETKGNALLDYEANSPINRSERYVLLIKDDKDELLYEMKHFPNYQKIKDELKDL
tara:strand:+ start:40 stop:432 length:393 start_codon:yes stop_codon:yes gene_type:complete